MTLPYAASSASGVGSFVRLLSRYLQEHNDEVTVVDPETFPRPTNFQNASLAVRSVIALFRRRRMTDLVHCQQLHAQSLFLALTGRLLGFPVVLTVHGRSPTPGGFRGLLFRFLESASLRAPNHLVFVASSLQAQFHSRGIVIPNGVDVRAIYMQRSSREIVRRELGIADAYVLLFLGRVTADKGIRELITAWNSLRKRTGVNLHLVLVGPVENDIAGFLDQKQYGDALHVMGATREPWRLLAAADLYVLPSTREGLPLSLLEAMAAGVPVVACDVGDVRKVVKPALTGVLAPPNDPVALETALWRAISDPKEMAETARRASDLVLTEHDSSKMGAAYRALFMEAMRSEN